LDFLKFSASLVIFIFSERSRSTLATSSTNQKSHVYTLEEQKKAEQYLDMIFNTEQQARSRSNSSSSTNSPAHTTTPHTDVRLFNFFILITFYNMLTMHSLVF